MVVVVVAVAVVITVVRAKSWQCLPPDNQDDDCDDGRQYDEASEDAESDEAS